MKTLLRLKAISSKRSAIVLAGGFSKRFGQDKGFLKLARRPLILHVLDKVSTVVDEIVVVVSSKSQEKYYARFLNPSVKIVVDKYEMQSPLVGALTGFENANGEYSLLLPCDTPFISSQIASLLLELCIHEDAVVPKWPNGYVEPLQAAYRIESALAAANKALENRRMNMRSMISYLSRVCYVSTLVLKKIDPKLMTFFNINAPKDLRRGEDVFLDECTMRKHAVPYEFIHSTRTASRAPINVKRMGAVGLQTT